MTPSAQALFTSNWNTYQKVVELNYMQHQECRVLLTEALKGIENLYILDLGCGDAGTLVPVLSKQNIAGYIGYDLSPTALALCEKNIGLITNNFQLKEGRMEELMELEKNMFNVVHSSYAMHHLNDKEKKKMIEAVYRHTEPGGKFILTDIYRTNEMGRHAYIFSYMEKIKSKWDRLDDEEKNRIYEHIHAFDFPCVKEDLMEWCKEVGFSVEKDRILDAHHFFIVLKK